MIKWWQSNERVNKKAGRESSSSEYVIKVLYVAQCILFSAQLIWCKQRWYVSYVPSESTSFRKHPYTSSQVRGRSFWSISWGNVWQKGSCIFNQDCAPLMRKNESCFHHALFSTFLSWDAPLHGGIQKGQVKKACLCFFIYIFNVMKPAMAPPRLIMLEVSGAMWVMNCERHNRSN